MKTYFTLNSSSIRVSLSVIIGLSTLILNSGCTSIKSQYVEPKFRSATYASLSAPPKPVSVTINVSFQTNGKPRPALNDLLRRQTLKVLNTSRVMADAGSSGTERVGRLDVTVNNYGNLGAAYATGFASGLTLGAVGTETVDHYTMTATYAPPGGAPVTKTYQHALHSMQGLVHPPATALTPIPSGKQAFEVILEDMLLNFLHDLQREHKL